MIPVLVGVLLSYTVAKSLSMSVFDVLLEMKGLPFLPSLTSVEHYSQNAGDIMNKNFLHLNENANLSEIVTIINKVGA